VRRISSLINYRPIQTKDLPALFRIRASTRENSISLDELYAAGITEESVANRLQSTHGGWLCEIDGEAAGFSVGNTSTGELWVIAVRPDLEGRGIGSELLSLVERSLWSSGAEELWLVTAADRSKRAYSLYRSHGWVDDGEKGGSLRMKKTRAV